MIFIGDLHGEWPEFRHQIVRYQLCKKSFIQVGDFGLGFRTIAEDIEALQSLDTFLKEKDNWLYVIRGNHDNKWFWDHHEQFNLQRIILVSDYATHLIEDKHILFIGGGISIDRLNRTANKNYWSDEIFCLNEPLLQQICAHPIDIIVTHIAPAGIWPYSLAPIVERFMIRDHQLQADLLLERKQMRTVLDYIKTTGCKHWIYGHYHAPVTEEKDGITFRCLNIHEHYEDH